MSEEDLALTGVTRSVAEQVRTLAEQAQTAGLPAVVASPQETGHAARRRWACSAYIVTPGVRPAGRARMIKAASQHHAKRSDNGASHLVIGMPITAAPDPALAFDNIVKGL